MQFNTTQNNLSPRFNIHGGGYLPLSYHATIHGSFQYQQEQIQNEVLLGAVYSYYMQPNPSQYVELYIGSWIRLGDAIIPYVAIDYNRIMWLFVVAMGKPKIANGTDIFSAVAIHGWLWQKAFTVISRKSHPKSSREQP